MKSIICEHLVRLQEKHIADLWKHYNSQPSCYHVDKEQLLDEIDLAGNILEKLEEQNE